MTEEPAPSGPQKVACVHCGVEKTVDLAETPDWQCPVCERYQDSMICPTCGSVVRTSLVKKAEE